MKDWALAYAAAGYAVIPVWWPDEDGRCACGKADCTRPAKHPIPSTGVKQATTDNDRVAAWWNEYPDANIAIATGQASGVIVIDVDMGEGKDGDISITQACADKGGVPRTLKASSGSGGRHYWYRWRANPFTRKIGFLKNVDYLSDGGYVIVQPSRNMKGPYTWDPEVGVTLPKEIKKLRNEEAELPVWFDELEGSDKTRGRKDARERRDQAVRARLIHNATLEFDPDKPEWVEALREGLTHVDPDDRDNWLMFGIILGRAFNRNDVGWQLYNEWSSRSAKYTDKGNEKVMRGNYYDSSMEMPQNGRPSSIATILRKAMDGGWVMPPGGPDRRPIVTYRKGRGVEGAWDVMRYLAAERESGADEEGIGGRIYSFGSGLGGIVEHHTTERYVNGQPPMGWPKKVLPYTVRMFGTRVTHTVNIIALSNANGSAQVECPPEITDYIIGTLGKHFPRLNGIVQWPMVMHKKIVGGDDPYDPVAGLLFALPDGMDLSGVKASRKDALAAWKWLREEALAEFPFATERDWSAALALMLTFVQRRAMSGAPAFLITAPIQGSGKTSLVRFMSSAIHGRMIGAGVLSLVPEEQRKAITAALMSNPPCLLWDNLKKGMCFDSAELAVAMTSGEWEDRRLGESERLVLPNRAVWCFTGNNISLKNDLRRRFVTLRMQPTTRGHHEKVFKRTLEDWAVEHRQEVLLALMSILLWGARSDVKLTRESGFKEWDHEVRRVVVALTNQDPYMSFQEQSDGERDDEELEAETAIAISWAVLCGGDRRTVSEWRERVHEAAKSSSASRKRIAEAVESAVAAIRETKIQNLQSQDWGYAIKTIEDKPLSVAGVDALFARRGVRGGVAVWDLTGWEAISAKVEAGF